jgi:hypothetical protein
LYALNNGNYVVESYTWNGNKGAATWGNGTTGTSGFVSSANSLVGSLTGDQVSHGGIKALSNGNYVVSSDYWNGKRGAVTWGNGTTGTSGVVSSTNSLVGSLADDQLGQEGSIIVLNNGNYVIQYTSWNEFRGAATWGNGTSGISGVASASNSLVGSSVNDSVGLVTALNNLRLG